MTACPEAAPSWESKTAWHYGLPHDTVFILQDRLLAVKTIFAVYIPLTAKTFIPALDTIPFLYLFENVRASIT